MYNKSVAPSYRFKARNVRQTFVKPHLRESGVLIFLHGTIYVMESTPESRFDEWWNETHDGSGDLDMDSDVDEVDFDQMSDRDEY